MRSIHAALLLTAGVSCAAPHAAAPASVSPKAASFRILRYDVEITPDIRARTMVGRTTLELTPAAPGLAQLRFPKNDLVIDAASMGGIDVPTRLEGDERVFDLPPGLRTDRPARVTVAYHGTAPQGLTFGETWVYSGYHTCTWMICRDDPGEKAAFSIRIDVPSTYKVVASGEPAPGRNVWTETQGFSAYLFGFAAGELTEVTTEVGGVELRLLGVDETPESLTRKFAPSADMLRYFAAKAGIGLPHHAYTQVLVPGSEAQEKSSFSIIGKEYLDPILSDPTEDWVIAHELAHQWWGNQVTCRTWSEEWLNEGVVTFLVAAYKQQRWGQGAYEREMQIAREGRERAIQARFDVPLASSRKYPSLRIMRAIAYAKGALFMDLLRRRIGDDAFWRALGSYTQANRGKAVDSRDMQAAMERASGVDLAPLFREWVYE